jgi:hypothetical protein
MKAKEFKERLVDGETIKLMVDEIRFNSSSPSR